MNKINRTTFFAKCRAAPFGGTLSQQQVDGLNKILDYWELHYADKDYRWLAYALATFFRETGATFQPIEEMGGEKYLKSKKYYPWYGRGLIQITWEANYKKFGVTMAQALEWPHALDIAFRGMINGMFTGKKLSQYFNETTEDPIGARRIVNGTDKASLISGYYDNFKGAIELAMKEEAKTPNAVTKEEAKPDGKPLAVDPQTIAVVGSTAGATLIAAVNSPWAVAALAIIVVAIGLGVFIYFRKKEKYTGIIQ